MRYVSEQFQAIQDEIIRPQLQIHFEVNTDNTEAKSVSDWGEYVNPGFDDTVAPVVAQKTCLNEHYYAVLGDTVGVDDPNRICAPDNSGTFSTPKTSVPYGITPYTVANTETLIGTDDPEEYYYNFTLVKGGTLHFKGLIPEEVRVESYDRESGIWSTETTIINTDMSEDIKYVVDTVNWNSLVRFYVKNSTTAGRFQLLWIKPVLTSYSGNPVVFENEYVSNVSISMETDLTSQSLPQYEMTVECLDVEEIYTPESSYWDNEFSEGKYCLLKAGYEIGGIVEYIPMMYGVLTQKPSYSEGKITFNVSFKYIVSWSIDFMSLPNNSYSTGALVDGTTFKDIIDDNLLFNSYDIFRDTNDENNSLCNYYGAPKGTEAVQLIANALGGYLTVDFGFSSYDYDLHDTNAVQYKTYDDYLKRSEQTQCNMESQPKVGRIQITRHQYKLSSSYSDVKSGSVRLSQGEQDISFNVPFYAIGKTTAQSFPSGYSITGFDNEYANEDGTIRADVTIKKTTSGSATQNLTVRFFQVDDNELIENENLSSANAGEIYENSNPLITNSYVAGKAKRVAHMINDVPDKYEVDYMQDLRYELGDVIRLETQEGVFKSCIITGLEYSLPGSAGRLTCRKIFSLLDCPQAVFDPDGLTIRYKTVYDPDYYTNTILETSENGVVVGLMKFDATESLFFVLGVTKMRREYNGTETSEYLTNFLTDLNGHKWGFVYHFIDSDYFETNAPIIELPDYDSTTGLDSHTFGIINMVQKMYALQGMTAPVDYTCTVEQIA